MLGHEDYRGLRQLREKQGDGAALAFVRNLLESREAKADDFRIGPLFFALYPHGRELAEEHRTGGFSDATERHLLEAGPVRSSEFSRITGQIVYSKTLEYFENEEFAFTKEVDTMPSPFIGMEKIAGIGKVGDDSEVIDEGAPVPGTGPVEDYIEAPFALKRGQKVALTWEAVFTDRTGDLLRQAQDVGYGLGLNKEKRIIDAIVDENAGAKSAALGGHRYHWFGTSYATHQTSTPWVNVQTSNALVDWTDIESAELVHSRIRDQHTGEPVNIVLDSIVVTYQLRYTAMHILQATQHRVAAGGFPTNATATQMYVSNFLPKYKIVTSKLLETRMTTDTDWYLANLKRLVKYKEIRPLKVEQAPANHPDEFDREIVNQWKCTEFGNPFVEEPRAVIESRA